MIRVGLTRADGSVDHVEVEGVTPVADLNGGPYVGEADIKVLFPEWQRSYVGDDEGYPTIAEINGHEVAGMIDDDGYNVWPASALPGFVSVDEGAL
jgi:hypothetical protein